jgi:hypothetical protein
MRRIKIVKMYCTDRYDYESPETTRSFADGIEWHDVDDKRFVELTSLISFANQHRYHLEADYDLIMIEEVVPANVESHLEKAKALQNEILEKQRKQREKDEKARILREEKRKTTDIERKRKQLEKLQRELEESDNE